MSETAQGAKPVSGRKDDRETITVHLGTVTTGGDFRRAYRFRGRELTSASTRTPGNDTRGTDWTLYEVRGGYRVYVHQWSRWQGERDFHFLALASPGDDEDDYPSHENDLKGEVLTALQAGRAAPAVWNEAVREGLVKEVAEDLEPEVSR